MEGRGRVAMRKFVAVSSLALIGAALPPSPEPPPGEGVLCMMVFVDVAAETGRRCYAGQNPEFQARVESAEAKFDAYFLKNTPATPEQLAEFKHRQAGVGEAKFECKDGDTIWNYEHFLAADPQRLTTDVDKFLSRPGKPTFGDCT